jgi:hypothetical protein
MAFLDDPTQVRRAGESALAPTSYTAPANPYLTAPTGYTPTDWTKLIQGNSGYMGWALNAAERKDTAAANRTAALRSLAIRYGGLPSGFKDPYGDIDAGTLNQSQSNPLSESSRLAKSYADSTEQFKRSLAARNALQSGDLGYGLGQIDYQHSADEYDLGQQFMDAAQQAINQYSGTVAGLSAEQIDAIRQAAMDAYNMGLRGGGASAAGGVGGAGGSGGSGLQWPGLAMQNLSAAGYSDEQIQNAVYKTMAERGWGNYIVNGDSNLPSIHDDGQRHNADGSLNNATGEYIYVKVGYPGGAPSTELIYIGPPASQTPQVATPPPPDVTPPPVAPSVYPSPAPRPSIGGTYYVGSGIRVE